MCPDHQSILVIVAYIFTHNHLLLHQHTQHTVVDGLRRAGALKGVCLAIRAEDSSWKCLVFQLRAEVSRGGDNMAAAAHPSTHHTLPEITGSTGYGESRLGEGERGESKRAREQGWKSERERGKGEQGRKESGVKLSHMHTQNKGQSQSDY